MATFTYTPELPIAETLSSSLGKAAGGIGAKAIATLAELGDKLEDICIRVAQGNTGAYAELEQIEKVIDNIEKTLDTVEGGAKGISDALKAVEAALVAARIALTVANIAAAIPGMPPILAIACQTVGELIAQTQQVVSALESVLENLLGILSPIREMLRRLRALIKTLYVSQALEEVLQNDGVTEKDKRDLRDRGLVDNSGQNIFPKVAATLLNDESTILSLGGAEDGSDSIGNSFSSVPDPEGISVPGLDLTSTEIRNRILATGTRNETIGIPIGNYGDWIVDIYRESESRPNTPTEKTIPPAGWTLREPSTWQNWWWSRAVVSGRTGKPGPWSIPVGYGTKPVKGSGEDFSEDELSGDTEIVELDVVHSTPDTDPSDYSDSENQTALVVNPDDAYEIILTLIEDLNDSPVGEEVKEPVRDLLDTVETPTKEDYLIDPDLYYRDSNGNLYTLKVVTDPKSPAIAPLRYVEVIDDSGTVVYTGTKTFATNTSIILEETRVRLYQLLG